MWEWVWYLLFGRESPTKLREKWSSSGGYKFYTFRQYKTHNPVDWECNRIDHAVVIGPEYVIVRARSAAEANEKAEWRGIYFDGIRRGGDCPRCGQRWERVTESDGKDQPTINGEIIDFLNPDIELREDENGEYKLTNDGRTYVHYTP